MAQKVEVLLIDDLHRWQSEGTEEIPADESIEFAVSGRRYVIDLSKENAEKFYEDLDPYIQAASQRLPRGREKRGRSSASRRRSADIRAWANNHGYSVSDRGRIPEAVVADYEAKH